MWEWGLREFGRATGSSVTNSVVKERKERRLQFYVFFASKLTLLYLKWEGRELPGACLCRGSKRQTEKSRKWNLLGKI